MKNEFENSDKRLQEKLEGFRMAAPEGAWAGIEGNIGGNAGRGRFFYVWIALLFIGVTGAGVLTFLFVSAEDENAAKSSSVAMNSASDSNQNELTANSNKDIISETSAASTISNEASNANSGTRNSSNTASQHFVKSNATNPQGTRAQSGSSNNNGLSASTSTQNTSNSGSQTQNAASNTSASASNSNASNTTSNTTANNSSTNSTANQTTNTANNETVASNSTNSGDAEGKTWNTTNESTTSKASDEESNALAGNNSNTSDNTNSNDSLAQSNNSSANSTETNAAENASNEQDSTGTLTTLPNPTTTDVIEVLGSDPLDPAVKIKPIWSLEGGLDVSAFNFNHTVASNVNLQQSLNASYSQNFTQAAFLRVNYQPFQQFSFHSGLEYAQNKITQDYSWLTTSTTIQYDTTGWVLDSITQQQVPVIDTVETITQTENLTQFRSTVSQVNIPLGVMFHIPLGRKSELGINATGLIGIRSGSTGEILIDQNGNSIAVTEAYRSVNFSARTALRYTYFIGGKTAIYAEPYLGFGLNDRSNSTLPFTTRFRNSGIRLGFRYNF